MSISNLFCRRKQARDTIRRMISSMVPEKEKGKHFVRSFLIERSVSLPQQDMVIRDTRDAIPSDVASLSMPNRK